MKKLEVFDSYDKEVVTKIDSRTVKLRNKCMAQAGWDFYCTKGTTLNHSLQEALSLLRPTAGKKLTEESNGMTESEAQV